MKGRMLGLSAVKTIRVIFILTLLDIASFVLGVNLRPVLVPLGQVLDACLGAQVAVFILWNASDVIRDVTSGRAARERRPALPGPYHAVMNPGGVTMAEFKSGWKTLQRASLSGTGVITSGASARAAMRRAQAAGTYSVNGVRYPVVPRASRLVDGRTGEVLSAEREDRVIARRATVACCACGGPVSIAGYVPWFAYLCGACDPEGR